MYYYYVVSGRGENVSHRNVEGSSVSRVLVMVVGELLSAASWFRRLAVSTKVARWWR